jgi:hypothetical protein
MKYQQNAVLASLRRAQEFLDANADALAGINSSARRELDDVVTQLSTLAVAQDVGARASKGETARLRALRSRLRNSHMAPIAQVAKYKLQAVPEFAALLLPPGNISAVGEVASAESMAEAAAPHAQIFADAGLSPTFLDDLRAAASAVSESIAGRNTHQARRNGATAALASNERRGRALLGVLHVLVLAKVGDDAQLRREWMTARVVRGKPGPAVGAQVHGARTAAVEPAAASITTAAVPLGVAA